jgi:hypothetical protein
MAKAVRVDIDNALLKEFLGITGTDIVFYHAQIVKTVWQRPSVEFVLYGDDLPDIFTVQAGDTIKKGVIVCHKEYVPSTIEPLEG